MVSFPATTRDRHGPSRPGRRVSLRIVFLWILCLPCLVTGSEPAAAGEYQVKAAFLLNFARFIEWPDTAFPAADSPIRLGIVGDDPFDGALKKLIQNETIKGRSLVVEEVPAGGPYDGLHLLFISPSESARVDDILGLTHHQATLTVSDLDGFAARGGIIRLYLRRNKIRFEINPHAAERHGLKLRSQLLNLGTIVGTSRP